MEHNIENIKKWRILALAAVLMAMWIFPVHLSYAAQTAQDPDYENMIFVWETLGVAEGEPEEKGIVSRGMAASMVSRLLFDAATGPSRGTFVDVPADHPYVTDIARMDAAGIVGGYGEGMFAPDKAIETAEAISMLVNALGYKTQAMELGGYPTGYYTLAARNGFLVTDTGQAPEEAISWTDFVKMLRRFGDAYPLVNASYGDNSEYQRDGVTILQAKLERMQLNMLEGVVSGLTRGENESSPGTVDIAGVTYENHGGVTGEMLGYAVTAFVTREGRPELRAAIKDARENRVLEITSRDLQTVSLKGIAYDNGSRLEEIHFSEPPVVVKNGGILGSQTDEDMIPVNGSVVLVDNNRDNKYEYVHVFSKEYFSVDRISMENNVIFLDEAQYLGSSLLYLDPENSGYVHTLEDAEGKSLPFSDLQPGDWFSVSGSKDGKEVAVRRLMQPIKAAPSEIGGREEGVKLGDQYYSFALDSAGEPLVNISDLKLGHSYLFYVDDGLLVAAEEEKSQEAYGFVVDAVKIQGLSAKVEYKILAEDKKLYSGQLADKVKYNGKRVSSSQIEPKTQIPIRYSLNDQGELESITESEEYGTRETRRYLEDTGIFTSLRYNYPLFMTEDTQVFVVPTSGEDEDYRANIKLTDQETYSMRAFDYDQNTSGVGAVVIYRDIAYDTPGVITAEAMPVMLKEKSVALDEEENLVYRLTWMEGTQEKTSLVKSTEAMNRIVDTMEMGDMFRYSISSINLVDNIELLIDLSPEPEYFHRGANTAQESVFGLAVNGVYNQLPKGRVGKFVNVLDLLMLDGTQKSFLINSSEDIYYYLYDKDQKTVKPAGFEDIMTDTAGDEVRQSRVYLYYADSETRAVAIVK